MAETFSESDRRVQAAEQRANFYGEAGPEQAQVLKRPPLPLGF